MSSSTITHLQPGEQPFFPTPSAIYPPWGYLESWTAYTKGGDKNNRQKGLYPMSPKCHHSPGTLICTPVSVKTTFPTQNLLCQPHCCAAAWFSHLPANRHQTQRARSRFFYRKTTCSCLKVRFNTENCKNEKISLKNRNQVQKKVNTTATGEKWCTKASTQKKPFCTAKLPEAKLHLWHSSSHQVLLVFNYPHYFRSNTQVFTLLAHHQVPKHPKIL